MVDFNSERMCLDFLIESLADNLSNLKPDQYRNTLADARQVTSVSEYNQRNLAQLQLDESVMLGKNIEFLSKMRKTVIS